MRLLPRSLFGRLLLLLMGGLILAQLLSAAIQLYDRGQVLHRAFGADIAQRIAALVNLLDTLPIGERRRLVAALDLPPTRISMDLPWQPDASATPSQIPLPLTALLRRYLPGDRPLWVEINDGNPPPFAEQRPDQTLPYRHRRGWYARDLEGKEFVVQVGLSDGGIVTFRHHLPEEVFSWPYRLLLILLILLISVALLAALAVRWLTRPLALLANAATELGRDIQRPPLDETGPLEVQRAARAFNTMQTRLIRYIQDRGRVLAAVSHDLKTPITRLRLRTELLEDETLKEKFQADLNEMQSMVQATLDFMRGTEHNEPVTLMDINALLESLQEDARDRGGEIHIQGVAQVPFRSRPLALKRCLTNLVDNALHYGQRAFIQVEDKLDRLSITIADAGPGIPEAELERVFEPFYRLEGSRSRHTGGTGLGLGIARNIARAHGGELTLANRRGGGLEARLELPR
jgi:signal transduction histidine kinase